VVALRIPVEGREELDDAPLLVALREYVAPEQPLPAATSCGAR
jgi:hypothetical protein